MASPSNRPLVGRDAERRLASEVLRRPDRPVLVLAGPAGIGKSRLADELAADAERQGLEVRTVRVTAASGRAPLGGLASVLPPRVIPASRRADLLVDAADALLDGGRERLLLIDDAHLLDAESAGALHLAASQGGLTMVATLRTGEPTDDAIAALWKDGFAERLDLEPLSRADTEALATSVLGGPLDGVSAADLYAATEGNPLFVRELLVGAVDDGRIRQQGGLHRFLVRPRTSRRLSELLGARLDDIGEAEREALELVAIAGAIGLDHLRRLASPPVLERLEQIGLIVVTDDGQRRPVRMSHPLYAELVLYRMGRIRELAVHRQLADELAALGARRHGDLLALARSRLLGGGEASSELWLSAAGQAYVEHDLDLAIDLAAAARRTGGGPQADIIGAKAHIQMGHQDDAADALVRALREAEEDHDIVVAAMDLSVIQFWSFGEEDAALATVAEARARVRDPLSHAHLVAHEASFEAMADRPMAALARVAPYLEQGEGLPYLLAVMAAGPALGVVGRAQEAIDLCDRCLPLRMELGDDQAMPDAFKYIVAKAFALGDLGRLEECAILCQETYELASSLRVVPGVAWSAMLVGRTALLTGRIAEAESAFNESSQLFADLSDHGLRSWCLAGAVLAAAMAGDSVRAQERVADLNAVPPNPVRAMIADLDRARAWAVAATGDRALAREAMEQAIERSSASQTHGQGLALVHDLARIGDDRAARLLTAEHRGVQGALAAARLLYLDALAADDGPGLDASVAALASLGASLFAAEAAAAAVSAHLRAGAARRAATSAARLEELRASCPTAATPRLDAAPARAGLTAREHEVAELAATGLASRDIAEQLGRSVRTVDNHLQRVYDKLGVRNRSELGDALRDRSDPPR